MKKVTKQQLKEWIEIYAQSQSAKNVLQRSWTGVLIHRLRRENYPNESESASTRWIKAVNDNLNDLKKCKNFFDLYKKVKKINVRGIGELSKYDTATCIGCKNGIYPLVVYLHAGTAEGAKALGVVGTTATKEQFVEICDAFERLEPIQIEDFLCIFKSCLQGNMQECEKVCNKQKSHSKKNLKSNKPSCGCC